MKWLLIIPLLALMLAIAYIRLAPISYGLVHQDPENHGQAGNPGGFFVHPTNGDITSPSFSLSPKQLAGQINDQLIAMDGKRIDHNNKGYATYEFRSRVFGFPDFLSLKTITDENGKTRPIIYSRLYYGKSDFGVNRKRVEALLEQLN